MRSSWPLDRGRRWECRSFFSLMDSRAVCMQYVNAPRYIRGQSLSTCCFQKASVVPFSHLALSRSAGPPPSLIHTPTCTIPDVNLRSASQALHRNASKPSPGFCGSHIYAHRPVSPYHGSLTPSVAGQLSCKIHSSVSAAWQSHKYIHGTLRSS